MDVYTDKEWLICKSSIKMRYFVFDIDQAFCFIYWQLQFAVNLPSFPLWAVKYV